MANLQPNPFRPSSSWGFRFSSSFQSLNTELLELLLAHELVHSRHDACVVAAVVVARQDAMGAHEGPPRPQVQVDVLKPDAGRCWYGPACGICHCGIDRYPRHDLSGTAIRTAAPLNPRGHHPIGNPDWQSHGARVWGYTLKAQWQDPTRSQSGLRPSQCSEPLGL